MTDAFHIDVPHTDGALAVIALAGEFDIAAAPAVRARALDLIANGHPAWSPTSRASPSATPPAWAPSSASGATPWTPTPPSPWRPSGAASALGYLPSARATAPPPETSPSPGRHPTAGQQCTARPFPPAAHRAGPSAPRPTNWSRRALHPTHQALHGERRRAAHGMLAFPPRVGVTLFGAYDHGSDQYRAHRGEAAPGRVPRGGRRLPHRATRYTEQDDADACAWCARTTTRHTGRRSPGRTASGRPATEWTRWRGPDAVLRTNDVRRPLHRVEPTEWSGRSYEWCSCC